VWSTSRDLFWGLHYIFGTSLPPSIPPSLTPFVPPSLHLLLLSLSSYLPSFLSYFLTYLRAHELTRVGRSTGLYDAQSEFHRKTFFDRPMSTYLLTAAAVAVVTVAITGWIIYIQSVTFTTPMHSSKLRCQHIKMATKTLPMPKSPPWSDNSTISSAKMLYVWPNDASIYRLGNRLFNYASTFGIAWRSRHLPVLPDTVNEPVLQQYDLARFFNLRIPVDQGNRITRVNNCNTLMFKKVIKISTVVLRIV